MSDEARKRPGHQSAPVGLLLHLAFEDLLDRISLPPPVASSDLLTGVWPGRDPSRFCVIGGDPPLAGLQLSGGVVEVGPALIVCDGPGDVHVEIRAPVQVAVLHPGAALAKGMVEAVQVALDAAVVRRRRGFRRCVQCGDLLPVEMLTDLGGPEAGRVCHGCAQQHYGVVF